MYVAIITFMLCVLLFPCMQANKATYEMSRLHDLLNKILNMNIQYVS